MDKRFDRVEYSNPNGERIKSLRKELGLTQQELARRAGYSLRLMSKAESGKTIRASTLDVLVATFTDFGIPVTGKDLCCNPLSIAKQFVSEFRCQEENLGRSNQLMLALELEIDVAGDPAIIPFAGHFVGAEGLQQFSKRLFQLLSRPEPQHFKPRYYTSGNEVVATGVDLMAERKPSGNSRPFQVFIIMKFVIQNGQISKLQFLYDTHAVVQNLPFSQERTEKAQQGKSLKVAEN